MNHVGRHPGFSDIITPYIQNIATLEFFELRTPQDLIQTVPNFPRSTPNLRSLEISLCDDAPNWDPAIDPFGSFPSTLRHLFLDDIPLYPTVLRVRTLTKITFQNFEFSFPLDPLLTLLEENPLLEHAVLWIEFTGPALRVSQRRVPVRNKLRHLGVTSTDVENIKALVSSIPLQRGANLEIVAFNWSAELKGILSGIPATHLANLRSPTHMYTCEGDIKLSGPNGSFSFSGLSPSEAFRVGSSLPSFKDIQELRFGYPGQRRSIPRVFDPSPFPALETLALEHDSNVSNTLSLLFSSPKSSPSLKTLAFLHCNLTGDFMEELVRFASNRKNTTSAWLYRVFIAHSGEFPGIDPIRALGKYVPVVDVRFATKLPTDLT